ncbi:MAG: tetratricopeptide repeat protein [Phycisphaeraceae bacterium]
MAHPALARLSTWTCLAAIALSLIACQSGQSGQSGAANESEQGDTQATATASVPDTLATPPVPRPENFQPLTGDKLERARKSLDDILADLETPDYLQAPEENAEDTEQPASDEPPLAAQHAYVAGRAAWYEGNTYQAISELESALRLAPDRPEILRLLGRIYTDAGNKVRGAANFEKAVRADPTHLESVFLLGRFAMEQGDHDQAIVILHHALEQARRQADDDRAVEPLLHYYLAGALRERGYAAAAIEQHEQYLATERRGRSLSRTGRELAIISDQAHFTWTAIGDMHHQLGQPADALAAYRRALEKQQDEQEENAPAELIARLIYTHLRLDQLESAYELAIDHVRRTDADDAALALVRYLTEQVSSSEQMAAQLRDVYRDQGRPGGLVIAVADLLPEDEGRALLREHLDDHPDDLRVFEGLLQRLLPNGATDVAPATLAEAITVTATAMTESGERIERRAELLFDVADDAAALLPGFDALDPDTTPDIAPMVHLLRGLALMRAGMPDQAAAPLRQAMQAAPHLDAARLALASLAIHESDYARARELLEPLAESDDPRVVHLRVRALAETGDLDGALRLLSEHVDQDDPNVELLLQKAQLQVRAGEPASAERTLLDALNMYPTDQRIYQALFNMYDPADGRAPLIDDATRQWQRLVRRLLDTIPNSRLGRLKRAELYEARGQVHEALNLLEGLLREHPMDMEAIQRVLRLYEASDQRDKGVALLEQRIAAHPKHLGLLTLALQFYHTIEDRQRALDVIDRVLALEPRDPQRLQPIVLVAVRLDAPAKAIEAIDQALAAERLESPMRLVSLLRLAMRRAGRGDEAVDRLRDLADRFPDHEADIRNQLSFLLQQLGRNDEAEQVLIDTLKDHPDHAPTNNALGYDWARQGRNLERAKAMIEKALEAEPNSAAYLDSLGWVYYKLGDFDEAVKWLERARSAEGGDDAVILDHLGDALYRAGRPEEARRAWSRAASLHGRAPFPEEYPEMDGLQERAYEKIQAVREEEQPPVADVAEPQQANEPEPDADAQQAE